MDTLSKISNLLSNQGKTQKELTDYLGIQKSAFTQWKLGKNSSYTKHISKIAEFLGVSTDYLLGKAPDITDDAIKFALFGGEEGVTDEMYEKVKAFAKFVKEQEQNK